MKIEKKIENKKHEIIQYKHFNYTCMWNENNGKLLI